MAQNNYKAGAYFDELNQVEVGFRAPQAPADGNGQLWAKDLIRGIEIPSPRGQIALFELPISCIIGEEAGTTTDMMIISPYMDDQQESDSMWLEHELLTFDVSQGDFDTSIRYAGIPGETVDIILMRDYPLSNISIASEDPDQNLDILDEQIDLNNAGLSVTRFSIIAGQEAAIIISLTYS